MTAPDLVLTSHTSATEGWDTDRNDADLHYVARESADGDARLWLGQHNGVDDCAVLVVALGVDVTLRCSRARLAAWHAEVGRMLAAADQAVVDADGAALDAWNQAVAR